MCDQPPPPSRATGLDDREVRVGLAGGETAFVGVAWLAVEVRVARFLVPSQNMTVSLLLVMSQNGYTYHTYLGDESVDWAIAAAVSGSGNSLGWLRVATIFATRFRLALKRY